MEVVLVTRNSAFQMYCANKLWRDRRISTVLVENGKSFRQRTSLGGAVNSVRRNLPVLLPTVLRDPAMLAHYWKLLQNQDLYFGSQDAHNRRILQDDYGSFAAGLSVVEVESINSKQAEEQLRRVAPKAVLVFGTALIRSQLFKSYPVPWINMHWGWSPDYRGDGIISALAREGPSALGVTVHQLSSKIDGGDIFYRDRPVIDTLDNFYSIGLKLTQLGLALFAQVLDDFARNGRLVGVTQDLSKGRFYGSRFLKTNPQLCHQAWRNLKSESTR